MACGQLMLWSVLLQVGWGDEGQADEEGDGAKSTSDARLCLKGSRSRAVFSPLLISFNLHDQIFNGYSYHYDILPD